MRGLAWTVCIIALGLGLAACSEMRPEDSKKEVRQHWDTMRARLKYQLALDSFNSGQLDQAHERLRESLALDSMAAPAYALLGKILLERGEVAAASQALEQAAQYGGDKQGEVPYLRGLIAQRYERFEEALSWYRQASFADPMNAHYVAAVAETLVALGRPNEALALARGRWTDFEQNATLRSLTAGIEMLLGRYEEAADAYREALRLAPQDDILRWRLGSALVLAGRHEEAADVLACATQSDKQAPTTALVDLGHASLELGRADQAKTLLRQATSQEPTLVSGWLWLARASLMCEDLVTARRSAQEAVRIEPDNDGHHILLAYVCLRQKDYPAAEASSQVILRQRPDDPLALHLLHLAQSHLDLSEASYRSLPMTSESDPAAAGRLAEISEHDIGGSTAPTTEAHLNRRARSP
ncbi:MAG: tetratricopeptide repeat protein [Phycisphaerae bacterium]|nr:tetratricopeptide repeat protein [Phycisphaerae bacterium]